MMEGTTHAELSLVAAACAVVFAMPLIAAEAPVVIKIPRLAVEASEKLASGPAASSARSRTSLRCSSPRSASRPGRSVSSSACSLSASCSWSRWWAACYGDAFTLLGNSGGSG